MSLAFAAEGADVVIGDVREDPREGGRPTVELIAEAGGSAGSSRPTPRAWDDIDRLVRTAVDRARAARRDGQQCDRRRPHSKGLLETTEDDWDAIMDVGLRGVFLCCKRAVQQMLDAGAGRPRRAGAIIDLSSQHGMIGAPGHVAYCTAKGGVVNLTRQVAVDFGPRGIVVNAIAPGQDPDPARPTSPTRPRCSPTRTPARRSPASAGPTTWPPRPSSWPRTSARYVSGTNLLVDGGWMAY